MRRAMPAWPDPSALVRSVGAEVVKQRAAKGEGEAQFSQGCRLVSRADADARALDGAADLLGASARSPTADVGLALFSHCSESLTGPRRVDAVT
jgi:hypothetical protein